MKRSKQIVFFLVLLLGFSGYAQQKQLWSKVDKSISKSEAITETVNAKTFKTYFLDVEKLTATLQSSKKEIEFPDADGNVVSYIYSETELMHPELAAKFEGIKTYKGVSKNDPLQQVYFTKSALGLHAMIISPDRPTFYIDPLSKDRKKYMAYKKSDVKPSDIFQCFAEEENDVLEKTISQKSTNDLVLRTFRLAIATTEEYSTYHVNAAGLGAGSTRQDSINVVMSSIVVAMARVNPIYERDVALTMQLVPNNDQLIFLATDPGNDPYTNNDGSAMLTQNQTTINSIIGFTNYDIGHVFSTGGGGVAYLKSACTNSKAGGVTGQPSPVGDPFYIDFVAHEMGHQFGANHTFNGTGGSCNGKRNNPTAVEPGSGSTIMAYAGICSPQNVQSHSDSYFHTVSIKEMRLNIISGNSQCAVQSPFNNNLHAPTANAGSNYTIPKSTPFVLKGAGNDLDGDELTYCWEQVDNEVTNIQIPPSSTQPEGAVFRSLTPSKSANRYMPSLPTVVSGSLSTTWEVIPSVARSMKFALTVRDNAPGEGQANTDFTTLTVTDAAGPFVVTSQNIDGIIWDEGATETITWDVAGTNANGINVNNVNILLSLDGGVTFTTVLAANTPNDGTEDIIVPNTSSGTVRLMVEAVDNIFYAVNSKNFSIGSFQTTCTNYSPTGLPMNIPDNNSTGIISTINVLDDFAITDVNVSLDITHTWLWDLQVSLISPNGTEVLIYDRSCGSSSDSRKNINAIFDDSAPEKVCDNTIPAIHGPTKPDNLLSLFNNESSFGLWKLKVVDNAAGDVGKLNSWTLNMCKTEQTVSVPEETLHNFNVYPNPFSSAFTVSFSSTNAENTLIILYDLQGRQVYQKLFDDTGSVFKKDIELGMLSSGIYLLNVKKGNQLANFKLIKY